MDLIEPETAREGQGQPHKQKPKPTKIDTQNMTPREIADAIAAEKWNIKKQPHPNDGPKPKQRKTKVTISFDVPPEVAAKLKAVADHRNTTQTAAIIDMIKRTRMR